jgi:hypothetical protein
MSGRDDVEGICDPQIGSVEFVDATGLEGRAIVPGATGFPFERRA